MTTLTREDVEELRTLFDSVGEDQSTITKRLRNVGRGLLDLASQSLSWQPIETAPKDRTWILLRGRNAVGQPMIPVVAAWCPYGSEGIGWKDSGSFKNCDGLAADPNADWRPLYDQLMDREAEIRREVIEFALKENDRISRMRSSFIAAKRGYFVNPGWEAPPERAEPPLPAAETQTESEVMPPEPNPAETPPGPAPATPGRADDWQLVPKEPTPEMERAMDSIERGPPTHRWRWIWSELLAASPSPPAQSVEGRD